MVRYRFFSFNLIFNGPIISLSLFVKGKRTRSLTLSLSLFSPGNSWSSPNTDAR